MADDRDPSRAFSQTLSLLLGESRARAAEDEMKNLKRESIRAQEEIKRVQSVPLVATPACCVYRSHHGCCFILNELT